MPEPIFQEGPLDTPYVYTVSGTGTVTPRCCAALYDGSGAAGDFLPAVIFKSQAGHVLSRAILQSTIVAGDDAEVSWFPGVSPPAAQAAAAAPVFARAWNDSFSGDTGQTVNAGATNNARFAHTSTTDASVITFATSVNTNDTAVFGANGTYLMYVGTHWDTVSTSLSSEIFRASGGENAFPHTPINPNTNPSFGDSVGSANSQDFAASHLPGGATTENVLLNNRLGTSQVVQQCYFVIVYLPTA